jgi:hypothetical protein
MNETGAQGLMPCVGLCISVVPSCGQYNWGTGFDCTAEARNETEELIVDGRTYNERFGEIELAGELRKYILRSITVCTVRIVG